MSLNQFIEYLSLEKKYSGHTVNAYSSDIREFESFCESSYDVDCIDIVPYSIVRSWVVSLSEDNISNRTINRKVASLKAYYKFLQKVGVIDVNPLAKHKALKIPKKLETPFSEAEMEDVFTSVSYSDDFEGRRDRLIVHVLYATGMRRAELVNLKLVNVDLESGHIKVLGKRNKERIIPLLEETKVFFRAYLDERPSLEKIADPDFVFLTKSGNKIYETLVYRIINRYFREVSAKVKKSPHILRHTFATHLLNKGADLNSVKELLGHASLASTQVYTHNSIAELKKVHAASHPRGKK
ncbi:tyrosine-type recombinase/integrase [Maribacter thermophilus]|uniref:tyrosine-type recombinase/integrase n=1 Tax=Maribacter thermophilus TaxID=1197874 RepID=UPI0006410E00|nr:tyrosine-type recombinase/integrase [Maribacter thermophilus]